MLEETFWMVLLNVPPGGEIPGGILELLPETTPVTLEETLVLLNVPPGGEIPGGFLELFPETNPVMLEETFCKVLLNVSP